MTQDNALENLREFCSPDVTYEDRMVTVAEGVALRVVTFSPSKDAGNPTVVLVAGWITQMTAWKTVLREMTREFRVIYVETREKISSQVRGDVEYSVSAIGRDLVTLIDQLGVAPGPYVMFGSSLGATAIVDCYAALTRKPLALVLVGPNAVFRVPKAWLIVVALFYPPFYVLIKPVVKWYLKNFRLNVRSDKEQYLKYCRALDAADPWKLKPAVLAVSKYEIWNRLEKVTSPTLLIEASKDVLHEPENLRKIASGIPHLVAVDLETNKGTHSERVVEEMRTFLAGRVSKSSFQVSR
jgi:pimeloyl-ACP methyl ester carboxylesterase